MQRGPLDSKLTAKDAVSSDDELDLEEVRRMKNRERAYLAQAHKEDNLPQSRRHAAQEYAALHEARTGQKVDPHSVYDYGPDEPETDLSPEAEADRRRRTHERALRAAAHNPRNSSAERRK